MNPSALFIARPVATTLIMLAICAVGALAYLSLPISALPSVDFPTIQVQTFYPGASPEVMASAVTAPLERQLGQMPNLKQMTSRSSGGASVITLQFSLDLALDVAEQQVQAAINAANSLLPSDLPAPPIYAKVNPADTAVLTLALTSATMPLTEVEDLAETRIAAKISQVSGVGLVSISGGQRPAMRVRFNAKALAAYGLAIDDLRTTLTNANVSTAKGTFDGKQRSYSLDANDQLKSLDEFKQTVVAYKNGAPVRLTDVAEIVKGPENTQISAWANKVPAIILNVQRQPGANVIKVVDDVKAILPRLQATLPVSIDVTPLTDRTVTIRASISDVQFELALAVGLVVLVIFLFLRNMRATLIPSLSVPLSLIGSFAAMYLWGFSLDNLSLMALTIASGFVVDDAIVVIENISRHIEDGATPAQAAFRGSREIVFTIISLTISLLAVLIPLLFMGDIVGRLFHEFAITLAASIVISAFISLTLVPMMCARILRPHETRRRENALSRLTASGFEKLTNSYSRMLGFVLNHQPATLLVAMATFGLTIYLYIIIPKGFFPDQDTGVLQGVTQAAQGVSFSAMAERQQALAAKILEDKDITSLSSFIGVDGSNTTLNSGRFLINLRSRDDRTRDAAAIIRDLQRATADINGITLFLQPVQDLTVETAVSATRYQFMLENPDQTQFQSWVPKLIERLKAEPTLADVASDMQQNGPSLFVDIDRAAAGRFGITPATIDNALYDSFGQRIISTVFTETNQYRVIMEGRENQGLSAFNTIYLPSASSSSTTKTGQVPFRAITTMTEREAPLSITHLGQFPAITISFNLAAGQSLGSAVEAVTKSTQDIGLPESFRLIYQGSVLAFQNSLTNELYLVFAAIAAVYLVLGVLYESFIHPLTILSTLPSAGVGALLALHLYGADLDVIGIIGIVLLIGIVKKNAIMIIDFALQAEREDGKAPRDAIFEACILRFRPILMTTFAALFAAIPLIIASGTGSELRRPLGLAIAGGLIASQLLTLFTTPVIYLAFDRLERRFRPSTVVNLSEDHA